MEAKNHHLSNIKISSANISHHGGQGLHTAGSHSSFPSGSRSRRLPTGWGLRGPCKRPGGWGSTLISCGWAAGDLFLARGSQPWRWWRSFSSSCGWSYDSSCREQSLPQKPERSSSGGSEGPWWGAVTLMKAGELFSSPSGQRKTGWRRSRSADQETRRCCPPPWPAAPPQTADCLLIGCCWQWSNRCCLRLSGGCWSVKTFSSCWPRPSPPLAVLRPVTQPPRHPPRPPQPSGSDWPAAWTAPAGGCRWSAASPPSSCTRQTSGWGWGWWCWNACECVPPTCVSVSLPGTSLLHKEAPLAAAHWSAAAASGWKTATQRWTFGGPYWSVQPHWASADGRIWPLHPPAEQLPSS